MKPKQKFIAQYADQIQAFDQMNEHCIQQLGIRFYQNLSIKGADLRKKIDEHYEEYESLLALQDDYADVFSFIQKHKTEIENYEMSFKKRIRYPVEYHVKKYMKSLGYKHFLINMNAMSRYMNYSQSVENYKFCFAQNREYLWSLSHGFFFIEVNLSHMDDQYAVFKIKIDDTELIKKQSELAEKMNHYEKQILTPDHENELHQQLNRHIKINKLMIKLYQEMMLFQVTENDVSLFNEGLNKSLN